MPHLDSTPHFSCECTHAKVRSPRSRAKFRMRGAGVWCARETDLPSSTGLAHRLLHLTVNSPALFTPPCGEFAVPNRFTCRCCWWLQGAQGVATTGGGGARSQPVAERSAGPRWAARERERAGGHGPAAAMDDDCSSEIVTEDVPERRHKVSTGRGGQPRRA